jgi:hypothetical protein
LGPIQTGMVCRLLFAKAGETLNMYWHSRSREGFLKGRTCEAED